MINYINYVYKLHATSYEQIEKDYIIHTDKSSYLLAQVDNVNWIVFLNFLTGTLNSRMFYSYKFIQNVEGKIISNINDSDYVLIDIGNDYNSELDLMDNLDFYKKSTAYLLTNNYSFKNKWLSLWNDKIIYLTKYANKLVININTMCLFNYYTGVVSSLISYLKKITNYERYQQSELVTICHPRIKFPLKKIDFYNPKNFIVDIEVRDIGEYIKSLYYSSRNYEVELKYYLSVNKLSTHDASYLYARILYPSYFLDLFENSKINQSNIGIFNVKNYEIFAKKIYELINSYINIQNITWL